MSNIHPKSRMWPLYAVLCFTTDVIVIPYIRSIRDLAEFLAGQSIWTHQLRVQADTCKTALLRQHPDLPCSAPNDKPALIPWLCQQEARFGVRIALIPAPELFEIGDPVQDMIERVGPERVTVIRSDGETS